MEGFFLWSIQFYAFWLLPFSVFHGPCKSADCRILFVNVVLRCYFFELNKVRYSAVEKDFYLDDRWLAAYLEKDWSDHFLKAGLNKSINFEYPKFDSNILYSNYHQEFVNFIIAECQKASLQPISLLEIGSSLGRTFYEICLKQPSVKLATLVEPSQLLALYFSKIFQTAGTSKFPMLIGNRELQQINFDSEHIRKACAQVDFNLINSQFLDVPDNKTYDLVICSNVIDQCFDPLALVKLLKESAKQGGVLALSCTYQWNDKYIDPLKQDITNVANLFEDEWTLLAEKDIEFKCRRSERHWMTFLSHALVFRRN